MDKTYRWAAITLGECSVMLELCGAGALAQEDWDARNAMAGELFRKHHRDTSRMRTFVISDGGHPNARQRKELSAAVGGQPNKQAVVTCAISNPIVQGVVTALTWLNPSNRVVGPERWREAVTHVNLEPHLDEVLERMRELQRGLPPNKTLAFVLKAAAQRTNMR